MYLYCYILNLFVTLYQAHVDLEAVDTAKDAVDAIQSHIDAIMERARLLNIDMTQWGPADFGFSKGQPGLMSTSEIRSYEEHVIAKSLEYGIPPRIEIGSPEQAKRYIDLGVRHFCIGWDRFIYRSALMSLGENMRELTAGI